MKRLQTVGLEELEGVVGGQVLCQQLAPTAWGNLIQAEMSGRYTGWGGKDNAHWGAYQFKQSTFNFAGGVGRVDKASPLEQDRAACNLYCKKKGGGAGHWPENGYLIAGTPCP
jgi:hypothetical protein